MKVHDCFADYGGVFNFYYYYYYYFLLKVILDVGVNRVLKSLW